METKCPECGEKAIVRYGTITTLIGFSTLTDPDGNVHRHNDNCLKQNFSCPNDHVWKLSVRRRCSVDGCNWAGKEECFCHSGKKVDSFHDDNIILVKDFSRMY